MADSETISVGGKIAEITGDPVAVAFVKNLHDSALETPEPNKSFPQTVPDYHREYNKVLVDNYNLKLRNEALENTVATLNQVIEDHHIEVAEKIDAAIADVEAAKAEAAIAAEKN